MSFLMTVNRFLKTGYFMNYLSWRRLRNQKDSVSNLKLADFYTGKLAATGITRSALGVLKRRFTADVHGQRTTDGRLILNEDFTYDDGRQFSRQWTLNALDLDEKKFLGSGADIHGDIHGEAKGCAALLIYTLKVPQKGGSFKKIDITHWQYQVTDTKTIHKLTLKKWFIPIIKSTVVFERLEP